MLRGLFENKHHLRRLYKGVTFATRLCKSLAMSPPRRPFAGAAFFLALAVLALGQQGFENNDNFNCYATNASTTLGYSCNGAARSCTSFLHFRSNPPYQSAVQISYLLSADAANISALNSISDVSPAPAGTDIFIPVPCSCSSEFYQHNASYVIKYTGETYLMVANDTYQGLSTCQALIAQNPSLESHHIVAGNRITVPLRCACPTASQIQRLGTRYLLSYIIASGDDIPTIASRFNATPASILDANSLSADQTIFPLNTLLIPLRTEPSRIATPPRSPPPPVVASPPESGQGGGGSDKTGIIIGVAVGVVAVVALCGFLFWFLFWRRRRTKPVLEGKAMEESKSSGVASALISADSVGDEVRGAIGSMKVYRFEELNKATGSFGDEHRIKGSVFKAVINGDDAVVKRLKGNASNEIMILKQINHYNVIRLSGFCLHEGRTYLVYEFAEKGSLADWIHSGKDLNDPCLSWKQRVQIAYDIAEGLNYLHNYANPPYVHKDLKSSNVLLDAEFRAKIANFGLARSVEQGEDAQLTRHVAGTHGYMAPEYIEHGLITPKMDVFAFGVVLLQLLSGKEATLPKQGSEGEEKGEVLLSACIEPVLRGEDVQSKLRAFLDPCLGNDYPFDLAYAMAQLAIHCLAYEPASRPAMMEILVTLSAIYNSTLDWDPSDVANSGSMVHGR